MLSHLRERATYTITIAQDYNEDSLMAVDAKSC